MDDKHNGVDQVMGTGMIPPFLVPAFDRDSIAARMPA